MLCIVLNMLIWISSLRIFWFRKWVFSSSVTLGSRCQLILLFPRKSGHKLTWLLSYIQHLIFLAKRNQQMYSLWEFCSSWWLSEPHHSSPLNFQIVITTFWKWNQATRISSDSIHTLDSCTEMALFQNVSWIWF